MQRALIQYRDPKNYELVREALIKAGREDLIGFDEKCLIWPKKGEHFSGSKPSSGGYHKGMQRKNAAEKRTTEEKSQKNTKNNRKKTIRNVHKKKSR